MCLGLDNTFQGHLIIRPLSGVLVSENNGEFGLFVLNQRSVTFTSVFHNGNAQ